ncbi:hypothetical protein ST37_04205 [Vibrio sp. qd031]|uniref:hypothetical protein n=1 Tax=Vibrio sp. qd031 TaxID=1603038 RepID=UPI000A10D789|nr:hypothetical protein [Vibrio sp. qd031]ORT51888.1 hypothetical protein ST37_04205 [Vibrio sp. qd031]
MSIVEDYCQFLDKGFPEKIVIAFSSSTPRGKFQYYKVLNDLKCNVILVNCPDTSYYHFGLPSLTLESTIEHIDGLLHQHRAESTKVICFGCSMGGYAALLYGSLLKGVDEIFAFSPTCPPFGERKNLLEEIDKHTVRYGEIRDKLFRSEASKLLIYGGLERSDYLSANEFSSLPNSEVMHRKNTCHSVVEPLLKTHSIGALFTRSTFQSDSFSSVNLGDHRDEIEALISGNGVGNRVRVMLGHYSQLTWQQKSILKLLICKTDIDISVPKSFIEDLISDQENFNYYTLVIILHYLKSNTLSKHQLEEITRLGLDLSDDESHTNVPLRNKMLKAIVGIVKYGDDVFIKSFMKQESNRNEQLDTLLVHDIVLAQNSSFAAARSVGVKNINDVPILRRLAAKYEQLGDIESAYCMIYLAKRINPKGKYLIGKSEHLRSAILESCL